MYAQLRGRAIPFFFSIGYCSSAFAGAGGNASPAKHNGAPIRGRKPDRRAEYISAVTRGAGFLPWQDKGLSDDERAFRQAIERRKDEMLAARAEVKHPVLLTDADIAQARRNIEAAEWARGWYQQHKDLADHIANQSDDYVKRMVPELTPTHGYGFTCPNCVGRKSQEAVGISLMAWDWRNPDVCSCRRCGHVYPSEKYPETARLVCPRSQQVFTYYLNDQERKHPEDRTGKHAWHWVGHPIHVSFTGVIRGQRIRFMIGAAYSLAVAHRFSGDTRYAQKGIQILVRLARCYRNWLYHDYWDTIADCDPMYAAYHDKQLRIEWKRHLCASAYEQDQLDRATMLQSYWGAGRIHPSTDAIGLAATLALAYDLLCDAHDCDGFSLWNAGDRAKVERDLLLEYIMGAEPFVGGPGKAAAVNNKTPAVYRAQAAVAQCLGLPDMADTALRGYEAVRDKSFTFDGYCRESPSYNNMYLSQLLQIPEALDGFRWPVGSGRGEAVVDLYETDARLRLMFQAMIDQLRPDGRLPPLSDTMVNARPSAHLMELGQKHYPQYYDGALPALYRGRAPTGYAVFNLAPEHVARDKGLNLPEIYFPAWMTAILRHGQGTDASMLTLTFSPAGGHRHEDNLALFYTERGHAVLGDHGYVRDMPVNAWVHSTFSHNLVIVDNAGQRHHGRCPQLHRFVTSPKVSLVEASSQVYDQCREYRRLVAMIKGPGSQTFAVDVFRVKGGDRHDYRLFSDLASSDVPEGTLEFTGLKMPKEEPLPKVGASLKREDILGLRDVRGVDDPPGAWQATWREPDRRYRVWLLCQADRVEASNGPGQQTREQAGRRVRYLDVIREGKALESIFVAVHEPNGPDRSMPIRRAERLAVPGVAGPDAVAVCIESAWGAYLVFSGFCRAAEVAGVRFEGAFGIVNQTPQGKRWMLASEATTFMTDGFGFEGTTPSWSGQIADQTASELITDSPRPHDWRAPPGNVASYVLIHTDQYRTGFPARAIEERLIEVERFPLPRSTRFRLPITRFLEER